MKLEHHALVSAGVSAATYALTSSPALALSSFLAGALVQITNRVAPMGHWLLWRAYKRFLLAETFPNPPRP